MQKQLFGALLVGLLFITAAGGLAAQAPPAEHQMAGMMDGPRPPLGVPMDRFGSGTTWIPDAVTLPSKHFNAGRWELMLHGFVFGQYMSQGGPRGDTQLGSLN